MVEHFKQDNFIRDHPGVAFPRHRALTSNDLAVLRQKLCRMLSLPGDADGLELIGKIREVSRLVGHLDLEADNCGFSEVIRSLPVAPELMVYINWYRFDTMDEFSWSDFVKFFEYLWYPSSDDIEVIDCNLSWILSITHYGDVALLTALRPLS